MSRNLDARKAYDLFRAWGWKPGRTKGGHLMMHKGNNTCPIKHPDRGGEGSFGALKAGANYEGVALDEFLSGPPSEAGSNQWKAQAAAALAAAEARVAAEAAKEVPMSESESESVNENMNLRERLAAVMEPGVTYTEVELQNATGWRNRSSIASALSISPTVDSLGKKRWRLADGAEKATWPPKAPKASKATAVSSGGSSSDASSSADGSWEMLVCLATLDDGRVLVQGDDNCVYVISEIKKVDL